MSSRRTIYITSVLVFGASAVVYAVLPHGELIQQLAAIPLISSLVAAVVQIIRDQGVYERQLLVQGAEQRFALGASSHMANVAFDKHVAFCEEYIQEVFETLETLFREGPTKKVLPHASALLQLRRKHALWLTSKLDNDLQRFEGALRKIGANDLYLQKSVNSADRQERINAMYKTFADVLGPENMGGNEWEGEALSPDLAIAGVIHGLRQVLGVEELTELRATLVQTALHDVRQNG